MRRIFFYLLICIFIFSCTKNKVPGDVLRRDEMKAVLWDMMRADELINVEAERDTALNRNKRSAELYQQVYKIHSIDMATFRRSVKFYERRPDLFQPILDSLKSMSERAATTPWNTPGQAAQVQPQFQKRVDSLKKKKRVNPD